MILEFIANHKSVIKKSTNIFLLLNS